MSNGWKDPYGFKHCYKTKSLLIVNFLSLTIAFSHKPSFVVMSPKLIIFKSNFLAVLRV